MGCASSKSPEDVGATPNQPLDGEPGNAIGNAIKKGARIVILGAAAGPKCSLGSAGARILCLLSEHLPGLGGSIPGVRGRATAPSHCAKGARMVILRASLHSCCGVTEERKACHEA